MTQIIVIFKGGPLDGSQKVIDDDETVVNSEIGLIVRYKDERYMCYHFEDDCREGIGVIEGEQVSAIELKFTGYAKEDELILDQKKDSN